MPSFLHRLWHSPTLMTWLNTAARVLSMTVVLPLVLRQFSPGDIALYYLFASIIGLQLMAGSGFVPTFSRFISFALSGAAMSDLQALRQGRGALSSQKSADPEVLGRLIGTLERIFLLLPLLTLPLMAGLGTWALLKPMGAASDPTSAWMAWGVILLITPWVLNANRFSTILQGANQVALDQRWSAVFVILGSVSGIVVLLLDGGLLALILSNQVWQLVSFIRLRWLAQRIQRAWPNSGSRTGFCRQTFAAIWPASWRSFIGVAASSGVTALCGLLFAQRLPAEPLARFLLGLRIMAILGDLSRAPFYSRIPHFNRLRAEGSIPVLHAHVRVSMQRALGAYVLGFALIPLVAGFALPLIGSQVQFPDMSFWCLLGAATLLERWGAMHLQVYSTTNDIIWHWLNGITGLIWLGLILLLFPVFAELAYPLAMFAAYLLCYAPIAVVRSLRSLQVPFWSYERASFVPAVLAFATAALCLSGWERWAR